MVSQFKKTIITSILLMSGMFLLVSVAAEETSIGHSVCIVTADQIRVQSEPGKHGLLQKTLKRGSKISIIKRRQGWVQILHAGEVGFIRDQAHLIQIVSRDKAAREVAKKPPDQQSQINEYEERKNHIRREIKQGRQEVEAFTRKESDTIKRLNQLEIALNKSKRQTAAIIKKINKIEEAIKEATTASD